MSTKILRGRARCIKFGEALTEPEQAAVTALLQTRGYQKEAANVLHIHANTLKYRLACVEAKWGAKDAGEVLVLAARMGADSPDADSVRRFVSWASVHAVQEGAFGPSLRLWLLQTLYEWEASLVERARATAAAVPSATVSSEGLQLSGDDVLAALECIRDERVADIVPPIRKADAA